MNRNNNMYEANINSQIEWLRESIIEYEKKLSQNKNKTTNKKSIKLYQMHRLLIEMETENEEMQLKGIEAFNSGGGIWLAEMPLDNGKTYIVLDSEDMDCLTLYEYKSEEEKYTMETMVWSASYSELPSEYRDIHKQLKAELEKAMGK